jgi:hypothetical protein
MIDPIEPTRSDQPAPRGMPVLAVPVDRSPNGVARAAEAGIEPSDWLDIAKNVLGGLSSFGI